MVISKLQLGPKHYSALVFVAIVSVTWLTASLARDAYVSDLRAELTEEAHLRAQSLADLIARETGSVDSLVAFVEVIKDDPETMTERLGAFAFQLMDRARTIRSVQVAPDSILEYVYPVAGNEAAVGLDLMADPDRRALLLPVIETGETVVQGPVELVQGGLGLLVRKPIYNEDGSFYGFAAILLDWLRVVEISGIEKQSDGLIVGTREGTGRVIAGSPMAFTGEPEIHSLRVGFTETVWQVALRPAGGWPTDSPSTPYIWVLGTAVAVIAALFTNEVLRRPEVLRAEREKVKNELAFAEARYQATVKHAAVGVVITDIEGRIVDANPAFYRIADRPDGSLKGVMSRELIHPDDAAQHFARMSRLTRGAAEVESEVRVSGQNDRLVRSIVTMISGSSGDDLFVAIIEDITERRQAEQELAVSEARFRQLFEQAPIAIQQEDYSLAVAEFEKMKAAGIIDLRRYVDGSKERLMHILGLVRIVDANAASGFLQGHLENSAGEPTLLDRESAPAIETFIDTLEAVWNGEPHLEQSVETVDADGSLLYLDVRWNTPLVDGRPDYSRMMVTISNISELRETQRRLEDLMESKDRFVASVAHELRTPLTAVVGFAQELKNEQLLYSEREKEEFRELIALHSVELSNIIEDLLVWARADIGEVKVHLGPTNIAHNVRMTLTSIDGLDVELDEPDGEVAGFADASRLRQIVRNLATNAVRYGGADVQVAVYRANGEAIVDFSDDGPKLSKHDIRRIFEPYYRSDGQRSMPGSIGLGLSVSRSLAWAQGGDLVCLRENDRNVFRLSLPLVREAAALSG